MNFGIWELVVIAVIVALLFGTGKLRTLGSDIGSAIKGLRNAMRDDDASAPGQKRDPVEGEIEGKEGPGDDRRA